MWPAMGARWPACRRPLLSLAGVISGGSGDGVAVVFNLGNLQNADSDPDRKYIVLEFNLLVDNITANQAFNNPDRRQPAPRPVDQQL